MVACWIAIRFYWIFSMWGSFEKEEANNVSLFTDSRWDMDPLPLSHGFLLETTMFCTFVFATRVLFALHIWNHESQQPPTFCRPFVIIRKATQYSQSHKFHMLHFAFAIRKMPMFHYNLCRDNLKDNFYFRRPISIWVSSVLYLWRASKLFLGALNKRDLNIDKAILKWIDH